MEFLYKPWPWYVAGPIIGLCVPALLLLGNKQLGVSSTLRQICAGCFPANIPFLRYEWKKDTWNLFFVSGILLGGFIGGYFFANPMPTGISENTVSLLKEQGITDIRGLLPSQVFNWPSLLSWKGFLMMVGGGFMVGFGTRYARGCTSGHGIVGLSALQWPSLVATVSFFLGGILFSHFVLPYILAL
ncbi:MAG: YeeE/YedE family protein [Cyclobacteriaceae bacterium]|jgi:uncharacterized membrane protein YedE/YeeE|nr:YeeE/YedE family protein [Cyclobacteriaceae bacterium]MDH4296205.1 YeeE/YedE family protein [Cyclobacteriaceae bacterium]MDH5250710.1 YeeE/YedE family protein [Cyclobacteriaceae bacterium]